MYNRSKTTISNLLRTFEKPLIKENTSVTWWLGWFRMTLDWDHTNRCYLLPISSSTVLSRGERSVDGVGSNVVPEVSSFVTEEVCILSSGEGVCSFRDSLSPNVLKVDVQSGWSIRKRFRVPAWGRICFEIKHVLVEHSDFSFWKKK